ncbi:MAG: hypothetical protein MHPSP_001324, partial [Paramarteilia canceri]
ESVRKIATRLEEYLKETFISENFFVELTENGFSIKTTQVFTILCPIITQSHQMINFDPTIHRSLDKLNFNDLVSKEQIENNFRQLRLYKKFQRNSSDNISLDIFKILRYFAKTISELDFIQDNDIVAILIKRRRQNNRVGSLASTLISVLRQISCLILDFEEFTSRKSSGSEKGKENISASIFQEILFKFLTDDYKTLFNCSNKLY